MNSSQLDNQSQFVSLFPIQKRQFRLIFADALNEGLDFIDTSLMVDQEGAVIPVYRPLYEFIKRDPDQRVYIDHDGRSENLLFNIAKNEDGRISLPKIALTYSHNEQVDESAPEYESNKVVKMVKTEIGDGGEEVQEEAYFSKNSEVILSNYNLVLIAGDETSLTALKQYVRDYVINCPLHKTEINVDGYIFQFNHEIINRYELNFQDITNGSMKNYNIVSTLLEVKEHSTSLRFIEDPNVYLDETLVNPI